MIKIFNHHLHRLTLMRALFDFLFLTLAICLPAVVNGASWFVALPQALPVSTALAASVMLINSATGFYEKAYDRPFSQTFARGVVALMLAMGVAYTVAAWLPAQYLTEPLLQQYAMGAAACLVLWRMYSAHAVSQGVRATNRVLIYGAGEAAAMAAQTLRSSDPHLRVVGHLMGPNESNIVVPRELVVRAEASLPEIAEMVDADEIVVALSERRGGSMSLRELLDCKISGIRVTDLNSHFERCLGQIRLEYLNASWLIFGGGFDQGFVRTSIKRLFDVAASLVLLVVALPVMLVAAIAIALESPGGVFYRQERTGLGGRAFNVIKFRSMRSDAEKDGTPQWAQKNDARVTRVGQFMRKTRIDELPQLINVLKGEMSMVGPRPERPFFVEQLTREIPFYAVRHSIKPGVTGWAQVRCEYGASVDETKSKLQYDLYYVKNHSLFLDLIVMLETVGVVLTGKGAR